MIIESEKVGESKGFRNAVKLIHYILEQGLFIIMAQ